MAEGMPPGVLVLLLALVPLALAAGTAFTKTSIVLAALRTGLGAEALLPTSAMFAAAILFTVVIMAPTLEGVWTGVANLGGLAGLWDAGMPGWQAALEPWYRFVVEHASVQEIEFFGQLTGRGHDHVLVVVPAFLVTELVEALAMAVVILVPFVAMDLVVGHALVLTNLSQVPVAVVAIPLKVLVFLAVGGWDMLVHGIAAGY